MVIGYSSVLSSWVCCDAVVRVLFLKIDEDGDDLVSPAELQSWMRRIQQRSSKTDTEKQWLEISPKDPDLLTWDEYLQFTYKDDKGDWTIIALYSGNCMLLPVQGRIGLATFSARIVIYFILVRCAGTSS